MNTYAQIPFVKIKSALVAYESELQRCYVGKLLQRLGCTAISCISDTADLLAHAREHDFDLFVTSARLPGTPILKLIDVLADSGREGYVIVSGLTDMRIQSAISEYAQQKGHNSIRLIFAGEPLRLFDFTDMLRSAGLPLALTGQAVLDEAPPRILPGDVLQAYRSGQIAIFFQPQYCLASGALLGAEGLVRWRHPERGVLGPDHFLSILEELGLGDQLINQLIDTVADVSGSLDMPNPPKLSINIPGRHIVSASWADSIVQRLRKAGGACNRIVIEITEDSVNSLDSNIAGAIAHWRLNGIDCAIDDFGTGASSLTRLCVAPFNILKIDRHLVWRSRLTTHVFQMLESVVELAHGLGMRVVAEGIETETDLLRMRSIKCDAGQGYYFSQPVSDADFCALAAASASNGFGQRMIQMP